LTTIACDIVITEIEYMPVLCGPKYNVLSEMLTESWLMRVANNLRWLRER